MTAKKSSHPPDDDYSFTYVHPSNLEGWDPAAYAPTIALPADLTPPGEPAPVITTTSKKES